MTHWIETLGVVRFSQEGRGEPSNLLDSGNNDEKQDGKARQGKASCYFVQNEAEVSEFA